MSRPIMRRVREPDVLPVTLADLWVHLSLIVEAEEAEPIDAPYVKALLEAAVGQLDGPFGLLNRCLIEQRWSVSLPYFPASIRMPVARVNEVRCVKYIAADGSPKTLPDTDWIAIGEGTDQCSVRPSAGKSFPDTQRDMPEAVMIEFTAGFGDCPEEVPADIRLALMEMVAAAYGSQLPPGVTSPLPSAASRVTTDWTYWSGLNWAQRL